MSEKSKVIKVMVPIRMSPAIHVTLVVLAAAEHRSLNQQIMHMLLVALIQREEQKTSGE